MCERIRAKWGVMMRVVSCLGVGVLFYILRVRERVGVSYNGGSLV